MMSFIIFGFFIGMMAAALNKPSNGIVLTRFIVLAVIGGIIGKAVYMFLAYMNDIHSQSLEAFTIVLCAVTVILIRKTLKPEKYLKSQDPELAL